MWWGSSGRGAGRWGRGRGGRRGKAGQGKVVGDLRQGYMETGQSLEHPICKGTSTARFHNAQRPRLMGSKSEF